MRQLIGRLLERFAAGMRLEALTETDDGWDLPFRGVAVTGASSLDGVYLGLDESQVCFTGPIEIAKAGRSTTFDPEESAPTEHLPLVSLIGQTVEVARVTLVGELIMEFSDGSRLTAKPLPYYEAWNATLDGSLLVCGPSGSMLAATPKADQKLIKMKDLIHRTATRKRG